MPLLTKSERNLAADIAAINNCNPFLPEWLELEAKILGTDRRGPRVWSIQFDQSRKHSDVQKLLGRVEPLVEATATKLANGEKANEQELRHYLDLVTFVLYQRNQHRLHRLVDQTESAGEPPRVTWWPDFQADADRLLQFPRQHLAVTPDTDHLLACFFQIRRAFVLIFDHIVGESIIAARLRASIWQSIFTHDLARYLGGRYRHMGDLTTLITGPSGTGKELVARAIGFSRYVPFDASTQRFTANHRELFFPLNLSALSPTLIESELFGHARGSFTGAVADRIGWLEVCPVMGTVFLDEIGELDVSIQVKLLRVLQGRQFSRLGETTTRRFEGKIVTATNRDLEQMLAGHEFREDLYYRLCSDMITTPSLAEQLSDSPGDLHMLITSIARHIAADELDDLVTETESWILEHLGADYPWPGNIRQLEQCVRNIWIRRSYYPVVRGAPEADTAKGFAAAVSAGELDVDELMTRYASMLYARLGTYEDVAQRLGIGWRTVKSKVDPEWVDRFKTSD